MRGIDLSSWESVVASLVGLALFALIGVGIRLVMMMTFQQRQQRMNRQINERLKTLIAAYKVLGGSFTGALDVDPRHLRDLREVLGSVGRWPPCAPALGLLGLVEPRPVHLCWACIGQRVVFVEHQTPHHCSGCQSPHRYRVQIVGCDLASVQGHYPQVQQYGTTDRAPSPDLIAAAVPCQFHIGRPTWCAACAEGSDITASFPRQ